MGLLDSLDDPANAGLLSLGLRLMSTPGNFGRALGTAGLGAMGDIQAARQQAEQRKHQGLQDQGLQQQLQMQALQYQEAQRQANEAMQQKVRDEQFRRSIQSPQGQASSAALANGGGPTVGNAAAMPSVDPFQQQLYNAMQLGQIKPMDYLAATKKDSAPIKLAAGEGLYQPGTYKPLALNPKEDTTPSAIKEYNFAVGQGFNGSFQDFTLAQKRAGASSTVVKVENKTGESLASQVGPMAKDSRIQTQGAVKMFDAADRLDGALNSKQVTSGPLASQIQTAKQFIQVVAGGNDESIRQTRQAIKSLAQMSVEARKQLQGQGQVTESEAAAVAKADSGDINDLTTGELRDLVTLTKRAAHYQAKSHQDLMTTLDGRPETKSLVPFYRVQGVEPILQHQPALPQIGGQVRRYNPQTGKLE